MFFNVIMFLMCFIVLFFLPNQNNLTAFWLRWIEMHNEKISLKIVKNSYLFLQINSSYGLLNPYHSFMWETDQKK